MYHVLSSTTVLNIDDNKKMCLEDQFSMISDIALYYYTVVVGLCFGQCAAIG